MTENPHSRLPEISALQPQKTDIIFRSDMLRRTEFNFTNFRTKSLLPSPRRTLQAGTLLRKAKERYGVSSNDISWTMVCPPETLEKFINGQVNLDLNRVSSAASIWIDNKDQDMAALRHMASEEQWIRTLTRDGMTLGRAIKFSRLSRKLTVSDFIKEVQIDDNLAKIEQDRVKPHPYTLNQIIGTTELDPMGIPAQVIRLQRERLLPMELAELQTCTFGDLFLYLRLLQGFSQRDVEKATRISQSMIGDIENNNVESSNVTTGKLISCLNLTPKSALANIIATKAEKPKDPVVIRDDEIQSVILGDYDGQYLFAESLQDYDFHEIRGTTTAINSLETVRKRLAVTDDRKKLIGTLLRHLREGRSLSQRTLAQSISMAQPDLWRIESGKKIPKDITIVKLLNAMDYDIHNPVTWYLLDIAETVDRTFR